MIVRGLHFGASGQRFQRRTNLCIDVGKIRKKTGICNLNTEEGPHWGDASSRRSIVSPSVSFLTLFSIPCFDEEPVLGAWCCGGVRRRIDQLLRGYPDIFPSFRENSELVREIEHREATHRSAHHILVRNISITKRAYYAKYKKNVSSRLCYALCR